MKQTRKQAVTAPPDPRALTSLAPRLLAWHADHGRHDLPWKADADPYAIWLSEIMLQQTQVSTVIPYFQRFITAFPDVHALAAADEDAVLALWTGLGYYARARNLHRAARLVVTRHNGQLPAAPAELQELPGIGRSTAGAIAAMAYDIPAPILDGNVKRVLARFHAVTEWPGERPTETLLWQWAAHHTPVERAAEYTQAIMDLGATLCTRKRPRCADCPLESDCGAHRAGLTDALPVPRPKKTVPERATQMLVIEDASGRFLLRRRPAAGVWGGLWCFPEAEPGADPVAAAARLLGVPGDRLGQPEPLPPMRHQFTHYRLCVAPVHLRLISLAPTPVADRGIDEDTDWFDVEAPGAIGLAAPVRHLLAQAPPLLMQFDEARDG